MPEFAFIDALGSYLGGAGLDPAPAQIGPAEPTAANQAPAVVLSLETVRRLRGGLGEGAEPMAGILPVATTIDLASPLLPGEPDLNLVAGDPLTLTLPHGGLIRADGLDGPPGAADLTVTVAGQPRTLVTADPDPGEYTADGTIGQLKFGAPLPASGLVEASYHLGAWERQVSLIAGDLTVTVRAKNAGDTATLSAAVARALARPAAVAGLKRLTPASVGAVTPPESSHGNTRAQTARYAFEYEHVVDAPDSSGGIIVTTPITTHLRLSRVDPETGVVLQDAEKVTEIG